MPTALTAETYPTIVTEPTVVLDCTASWCHPCHTFAPVFAHVAGNNPDLVFATVDVDAEPELSARFDVRAVPTIVALRDGVVVFRRPGVLSPDTLQSLVDRLRQVVPAPGAGRRL
ncbi:MAG: thioredoxin family protein [Actinobacteria bacterium]|nr:thioredoxin family protein [Actinomycetota bacterium]